MILSPQVLHGKIMFSSHFSQRLLFTAACFMLVSGLEAQQPPPREPDLIVVTAKKKPTYAYSSIDENMLQQQNPITSVLAVVDNLPGVLINEGDTFGGDDWSTTISMRGFQTSLDEQQIGITIDGLPNGNSNYGGGAKANRYIDSSNLGGVLVSQGTADIASRSNEALGGTLNFLTQDPLDEERFRVSATLGEYDARKFYGRYDTGTILDNTQAWISFSTADNKTWIDKSGETNREHLAAKIVSELDRVKLTAYVSWDDVHEDNYQRITLDEFAENPDWDRLTADWTGVPHVDQSYRRGWSTLRENLFGYARAEFPFGPAEFNVAGYFHTNQGRGDWLPPYVVDVTADGPGSANTELEAAPTTVLGGESIGLLTFVDSAGAALAPIPGCAGSLTFPYGGAGPEFDPQCFPADAIPAGSYRHSHYSKQRFGFTGDFNWTEDFDGFTNILRGGLWYEDYRREEFRDWHRILDSATGFRFNDVAYWRQYDREYPIDIFMYYLEDAVEAGPVTARFGIKQFLVDLKREDNFRGSKVTAATNSDSDILISGGLALRTPLDGLEFFAGYAENFAAIKDEVLEREASMLNRVQPETAKNIDIGVRYESGRLRGSLAYYRIDFENRITFIAPGSPAGIDFLVGTNGAYLNVGGVESDGFEMSLSYRVTDFISAYLSYTSNKAKYLGAGEFDLDDSLEIIPGNTVFGSAEDMFVVSADWNNNLFSAGVSSKWVGERWLDAGNTGRIDSYIVTDLYLGIHAEDITGWLSGIGLQLVVNNITDERYIGGVAGGWGGWLGAARTAALTLTADL